MLPIFCPPEKELSFRRHKILGLKWSRSLRTLLIGLLVAILGLVVKFRCMDHTQLHPPGNPTSLFFREGSSSD